MAVARVAAAVVFVVFGIGENEVVSLTLAPAELVLLWTGPGAAAIDPRLNERWRT
jgi:hypothetical protein